MQSSPASLLLSSAAVFPSRHPVSAVAPTTSSGGARRISGAAKTLEKSNVSSSSAAIPPSSTTRAVGYPARRSAIAEVQASADLDSALSSLGGILQVQDLNITLRYFGELRRWSEIIQLFHWMEKHEKLNFASYSSFIKYMGISCNTVKALQVYDSISDRSLKVNVSVCNSVLRCMIRNGRFESSIKLFDRMKYEGLSPDLVTYSTLLAGCAKVKDGYSKAMQLIHELEENGLQMDNVIYGTLLAICASNNLCEEAEVYFQQMKDRACVPNVFHYSSLLNAYSVDGNYSKADKLVKDMKSAGVEPNKVILTTLLKVYARGGLFEKSRELLAELEGLGYAKDEMPYCLLIDNLAKAGNIREARTIFAEMREKEVKSDGYAYSIMICAFCRSGLLKEAKQLAKDFEARYNKYDLVMLNTLLKAYCSSRDMESVMQMLKKMDELAIFPDCNTFQILIKYFCKENLYHLAYKTIEDMHGKGHQLDEELCSSLILEMGQAGFSSEAFSVYNLLRYSERTICKSLHQKMLDILVAARLLKDAYVVMKDNTESISPESLEKFAISFMNFGNVNLINDVLKAYNRSGHRVNQKVLHAAVSRYIGKPEKKELLLHLLQWMTGQGYIVDSASRNLLLKNSHLFGQKQLIAEILSKQQLMSRKLRNRELKR